LNRINDLISKSFLPDSGRFANHPPRQRAGGALGGGLVAVAQITFLV
jgi:hypothetical protein